MQNNETQWTPGPWRVSLVCNHAATPKQDRRSNYSGGIAYVWTKRPISGSPLTPTHSCCIAKVYEESLGGELYANARLIAAAPEMAELLERILRASDGPSGAGMGEARLCEQFAGMARALLAKIKGAAPHA